MKRILAVSLLCMIGISSADSTLKMTRCEKILAAGFYHEGVEAVCDFDNQTSEALHNIYTDTDCAAQVSAQRHNQIVANTLKDARERYAAQGKVAFCHTANRNAYGTAVDFLMKD